MVHAKVSFEVCKSRHHKSLDVKNLVAERFQVTFKLANKRKISIIELRECFPKFIKSVTLFQKFFCDRSITNMEISTEEQALAKRISCEMLTP